jgi:hypothetical protein
MQRLCQDLLFLHKPSFVVSNIMILSCTFIVKGKKSITCMKYPFLGKWKKNHIRPRIQKKRLCHEQAVISHQGLIYLFVDHYVVFFSLLLLRSFSYFSFSMHTHDQITKSN